MLRAEYLPDTANSPIVPDSARISQHGLPAQLEYQILDDGH